MVAVWYEVNSHQDVVLCSQWFFSVSVRVVTDQSWRVERVLDWYVGVEKMMFPMCFPLHVLVWASVE